MAAALIKLFSSLIDQSRHFTLLPRSPINTHNLGFGILPEDTLTRRLEEPGIEPPVSGRPALPPEPQPPLYVVTLKKNSCPFRILKKALFMLLSDFLQSKRNYCVTVSLNIYLWPQRRWFTSSKCQTTTPTLFWHYQRRFSSLNLTKP